MRAATCALCVLWACISVPHAQTPAHREVKRRTTPEVWHPRLEQFTPAGTLQTDFGSALSEAGYRKLRAALTWAAPSERTDYYFDAYDGGQFLLRTGGLPLKARIKRKKQGSQWQVSRFVAKDRVMVGTLGVYVHTTESWDGWLEGPQVTALLAAGDDFESRLPAGGAPLRASADAVEAAWQTLRAETPPPGLMVIEHILAGHAYRFYPRKVTIAKTRLSAPLPNFASPAVTLLLGTEPEVDASGHAILTYELEAEADGPVASTQVRPIARAIGRWMQRAGLTARDQEEVASLSNEYTLRQLGR